jgi:predicted small lipoprotein YifL
MRTKAILLLVALGLLVASCGVKNDLARPDGKVTPKEEPDPSKPPYPVGR